MITYNIEDALILIMFISVGGYLFGLLVSKGWINISVTALKAIFYSIAIFYLFVCCLFASWALSGVMGKTSFLTNLGSYGFLALSIIMGIEGYRIIHATLGKK